MKHMITRNQCSGGLRNTPSARTPSRGANISAPHRKSNTKLRFTNCLTIASLVALFLCHLLSNSHAYRLTILHTNDLHSHFDGSSPVNGGYSRISSVIETIRYQHHVPSQGEVVLTLDAGDFAVGTLYHAISVSEKFPEIRSVELDWLDRMRFDASVIGNHQFDNKEAVLRREIGRDRPMEKKSIYHDHELGGDNLMYNPEHVTPLLSSNLRVNEDEEACVQQDWFGNTSRILQEPFIIKRYSTEQGTDSLSVGIIGLQGPASAHLTTPFRHCVRFVGADEPNQNSWKDYVDITRDLAQTLKKERGVDVVIALTHSGAPEETRLLDAVNDKERLVDVHISSHTHVETFKMHSSGAVITQCREYGRQLGLLQLDYNRRTRRFQVLNAHVPTPERISLDQLTSLQSAIFPHHIPITPAIEQHPEIQELVESYSRLIDQHLLTNVHLPGQESENTVSLNQVICNVSLVQYHSNVHEFVKGLNDIFYTVSNQYLEQEENSHPLDFFLLPDAAVRISDDMLSVDRAALTFGDVFRIVSTGAVQEYVDEHHLPGSELVFFHLSKKDTVKLIEFLLQYSRFIDVNFSPSHSSSLSYSERWWGIPFYNRIHNVKINGVALDDLPEDHMVHIGTFSIVLQYVLVLEQLSWGLIKVDIRNEYGLLSSAMTTQKKSYIMLSEYFAALRSQSASSSADSEQAEAKKEPTEIASTVDIPEEQAEDCTSTTLTDKAKTRKSFQTILSKSPNHHMVHHHVQQLQNQTDVSTSKPKEPLIEPKLASIPPRRK